MYIARLSESIFLKIPIRRISLFDIEKNRSDIEEINAAIAACDEHLAHIVEYALSYLEDLKATIDQDLWKRNSNSMLSGGSQVTPMAK